MCSTWNWAFAGIKQYSHAPRALACTASRTSGSRGLCSSALPSRRSKGRSAGGMLTYVAGATRRGRAPRLCLVWAETSPQRCAAAATASAASWRACSSGTPRR